MIKIIDWTGKILFRGQHKDKEVDVVLDANRCICQSECTDCEGTGYVGDFYVAWEDENNQENVYERINY